ncbi:MAG: nucleoside-triphosphatase [bacterium]
MQKNILITGRPGSGKSTLLRKLIGRIPAKEGFVTNEILGEHGRLGFEVETRSGSKAVLAHINFNTPRKVSKYFVDIGSLESMLPAVSDFKDGGILYLDEIGQMQLFSERFKDLVLRYLDARNTCIATLSSVFEDGFTDAIRKRDDIVLVEISAANREEQEVFITQLLKKIEKARKYSSEPERFTRTESGIELHSEHGTRTLVHTEGKWHCDCEFFKRYGICSHAIAAGEFARM